MLEHLVASLLTIASIQASALTDDPTGVMHLHEWALTPDEAQSLHDVTRFQGLTPALHISNDDFIRTSEARHYASVV